MNSGPARKYILPVSLSVLGVAAVLLIWRANVPSASSQPIASVKPTTGAGTSAQVDAAMRGRIEKFCGDCHVLPSAEHFPKSAWHHEAKRGFQFYTDSGRTDLDAPPLQAVVSYYQSTAPEKLVAPPIVSSQRPVPIKFQVARFAPGDNPETPQRSTISAVNWIRRGPNAAGELFCSDMRRGEILIVELGKDVLKAKTYAKLPHPAVIRACDLNGDSQSELVAADLGSFLPEDHELGAVWWFDPSEAEPKGRPVLTGIGRVADVRPIDADQDGDQDLVVAEFGWHKTGGIHLLENQGFADGKPKLIQHILDRRPGTIHVPIADLNQDGLPDFAALISQEHESVVGFLNKGKLKFESQVFEKAQDPSIGSSGLSLVDLDGDGDLDALVTNGDSFDSFYMKPAHSVQWLENQGNLKFVRHLITPMAGAHSAQAGDLDGDGDVDIIAAAFLPKELRSQQPDVVFDSVILLEQTQPGKFERHALESGQCQHTAVEMADFDADGDLDFAVSNFTEFLDDNLPPLSVWWNLSQQDSTKK